MRKRTLIVLSLVLMSLGPAGASLYAQSEPAEVLEKVVIDVALDARTVSYNRLDAPATGALRGDLFVLNGYMYSGGNIPDGDTTYTFAPEPEGSIGRIVARGAFLVNEAEMASGAPDHKVTNQLFMWEDGTTLVTEGLEGIGPKKRAVIGGTGAYAGARGEVIEEVIGRNWTNGYNLRFTFTFKHAAVPAPADEELLKLRKRARVK